MWIVFTILIIVVCVVIAIKCSSDPSDDVVMTVTYKEKPMERSHEFINVINAPSEPTEVLSTPVESKSESSQNVSEDNFAEDKPKKHLLRNRVTIQPKTMPLRCNWNDIHDNSIVFSHISRHYDIFHK